MLSNSIFSVLLLILFTILLSCERVAYPQGERIYNSQCANCHMEEGQGLGTLIPPIKDSDYYLDNYDDLVCIITYGLSGEIVVNGVSYEEIMPAARKLTDAELSNLINYMNSKWYSTKEEVNLTNVRDDLKNCNPAH